MKHEVIVFLNQLVTAQDKVLDVLKKKQVLLVKPDKERLAVLTAEEERAIILLQQSLDHREKILESAHKQGFHADSIQTLCEQIFPKQNEWRTLIKASLNRSRQIRYLALVNWTVSQKSLIHLNQLLEMIETRGQGKTTYKQQKGKETPVSGGGLVDRVA